MPGENGRPPVPLRDVLLTALIRAFENLTAAEAIVQVKRYCAIGLIRMTRVPSYNTLLRVFAKPEHMALLHRLLAGSALPLIGLEDTWAVDGTGFGTSVYDHHYKQKHGAEAEKRKPTKHGWAGVKIVFGAQHAQFAELMLRLICHNAAQLVMAVQEFNVDPRYWAQDLIAKLPDFGTALPPERALERLGVKAPTSEVD